VRGRGGGGARPPPPPPPPRPVLLLYAYPSASSRRLADRPEDPPVVLGVPAFSLSSGLPSGRISR